MSRYISVHSSLKYKKMNTEKKLNKGVAKPPSSIPKVCFITLMIVSALYIGSFETFGKDAVITGILAYAILVPLFIAGIHATITGIKRKK